MGPCLCMFARMLWSIYTTFVTTYINCKHIYNQNSYMYFRCLDDRYVNNNDDLIKMIILTHKKITKKKHLQSEVEYCTLGR